MHDNRTDDRPRFSGRVPLFSVKRVGRGDRSRCCAARSKIISTRSSPEGEETDGGQASRARLVNKTITRESSAGQKNSSWKARFDSRAGNDLYASSRRVAPRDMA